MSIAIQLLQQFCSKGTPFLGLTVHPYLLTYDSGLAEVILGLLCDGTLSLKLPPQQCLASKLSASKGSFKMEGGEIGGQEAITHCPNMQSLGLPG